MVWEMFRFCGLMLIIGMWSTPSSWLRLLYLGPSLSSHPIKHAPLNTENSTARCTLFTANCSQSFHTDGYSLRNRDQSSKVICSTNCLKMLGWPWKWKIRGGEEIYVAEIFGYRLFEQSKLCHFYIMELHVLVFCHFLYRRCKIEWFDVLDKGKN